MARINKAKAIARLQKLLDEACELSWENRDSPKFLKWTADVDSALLHIFGEDSRQYSRLPGSYSITRTGIHRYLDSMVSIVASSLDDVKHYWEDDETLPRHPTDKSGALGIEAERINDGFRSKRVFVIHGRNNESKQAVARFLERIDLEPVILHEQPDSGRTIIEKFENYADVGFAVVLLTPDDVGSLQGEERNLKPRARQNVIFELGYFTSHLGRNRVYILTRDGVEIPTDYAGVLYNQLDDSGGWKMKLITELKNAGFNVDANKAL